MNSVQSRNLEFFQGFCFDGNRKTYLLNRVKNTEDKNGCLGLLDYFVLGKEIGRKLLDKIKK